MRIAILLSGEGRETYVSVYTDAPADVIVVDQACDHLNAEGFYRRLAVNPDKPDEKWTLAGAFFPNDSAVDPKFVEAIFNEQKNGSPPDDDEDGEGTEGQDRDSYTIE